MKTKEELTALREEVEALGENLAELSEDELAEVSGGIDKDTSLSGYLKRIVPDKSRILVDKDDGQKLSLNNSTGIDNDRKEPYVLHRPSSK